MSEHASVAPRECEKLVVAALERGASLGVAKEAAAITVRRMAGEDPDAGRVEAYFWGVVRRRLFGRSSGPCKLRSALLVATTVRELQEAGYAPELLFEELATHFGGSVEPEVLDAYRPSGLALAS